MRKLLVVLLVFAMSSAASAALQISIGGDPEPIDSEIWLTPSQTITLDVWTDAPIVSGVRPDNQYWALVAQTSCADISGGMAVISDDDWSFDIGDDAAGMGVPVGQGENGVWGYIVTFGPDIPVGVIFDEILFHCVIDNGPTDIILYELDDGGGMVGIWDTAVIHQLPEPATIALLGLGGLALLRRRK